MDKPKQVTPQEVEHAVSELRRQMEGLAQTPINGWTARRKRSSRVWRNWCSG